MPSFQDSIVMFVLALILFGPERLPKLAREVGKWVGEFRRASNEFKLQMEEEMRIIERQDREKKIAAIEAAAPLPAIPSNADSIADPEHPHLGELTDSSEDDPATGPESESGSEYDDPYDDDDYDGTGYDHAAVEATADTTVPVPSKPVPIATAGDVNLMPPATGLPRPRSPRASSSPLGGLLDRIPAVDKPQDKPQAAPQAAPQEAAPQEAKSQEATSQAIPRTASETAPETAPETASETASLAEITETAAHG